MFRDEKLELKVGLFIGIGIFLMFLIVFSIKDITMFGTGYDISVIFDFVNGIDESSPVRLAGVDIGQIKTVELVYGEEGGTTKVKLDVRVKGGVKIEEDAIARINTLGLLGEQYLEITPGVSKNFLAEGDVIDGHNPLFVGAQMEKMNELISSIASIAKQIEKGEGTVGKLLMEDDIYNNLEAFTADIKAHPWKLLKKPRD